MGLINVLVVDDSALIRLKIKQILEQDPEIRVIDTARNGDEALNKIQGMNPDVVTMDVEMPKMNGLDTLRKIMERRPLPVIMLSALTSQGTMETMNALESGAVDFIQKPAIFDRQALEAFERGLTEKVKIAAKSTVKTQKAEIPRTVTLTEEIPRGRSVEMVAIGTSTGGPAALYQLIPRLPGGLPVPIVVVQHIPKGFTGPMAARLDKNSQLTVVEAEEGMTLKPKQVYIAPAGHVLTLKKTGRGVEIVLDEFETKSPFKPSVNDMMLSAAEIYGGKMLGVILTGMGNDGVLGMEAIKRHGGRTLVEAESSCVVYGMPKSAVDAGVVDEIVDLSDMPERVVKNVLGRTKGI